MFMHITGRSSNCRQPGPPHRLFCLFVPRPLLSQNPRTTQLVYNLAIPSATQLQRSLEVGHCTAVLVQPLQRRSAPHERLDAERVAGAAMECIRNVQHLKMGGSCT